jgi:hypothetical protein
MTPELQDQHIRHRMAMLREEVRSGATEMTGKTYRDASGRIAGRFGGGMSILYPELRYSGLTPKQASDAVGRGKGKRWKRLYRAAKREVVREYGKARRWYRGRLSEAPHPGYVYCKHCREFHSRNEHRFHGAGSFNRTHLFSFGGKNPVRRNPYDAIEIEAPTRAAAIKAVQRYLWGGDDVVKTRQIRPGVFLITVMRAFERRNPVRYSRGGRVNRSKAVGVRRVRGKLARRNPYRAPGVKIYERLSKVYAQKGPGHKCDPKCKRAGHWYYHVFTSRPKMYGLANGDVLISSR